jgi:hypothetical protein
MKDNKNLPETPLSWGTGTTAAAFKRVQKKKLAGLEGLHPGEIGQPQESGHD